MSGCDCSRCQTEGCVANTYCPCCLKAERDVLRAQIERARELHYPVRYEEMTTEGSRDIEHCNECRYIYDDGEPCPTILALDGADDDQLHAYL